MERKLLTIFKDICKTNDKLITEVDDIIPMCFLISKKNKLISFPIGFKSQEEKIKLKSKLKKLLSMATMKGYILIQDTKVTTFDKKKNILEVHDAILRSLYTPKENRVDLAFYRNKKIIKIDKITDKKDGKKEFQSEWDLWGGGVKRNAKDKFDYYKFKMENKKLYERVVDPFDDYSRIYSNNEKKKENIIFAYKFNHQEETIKYYITQEFKKKNIDIHIIFKKSGYKLIELNKNEEIKV